MTEKPGFKDSALRAISIIGLIAILVLGAWGIIQLVFGLPSFLSSLGSPTPTVRTASTAEQITLATPNIVNSDQPFMLSWRHTNSTGNYGYSVSYSCATDLTFAAPVPTGALQVVPCNTLFNYTNATQSLQLTPILHTKSQVTTTFTVVANRLSDGKITASSTSASVTVLPARATAGASQTTTQGAPAAKAIAPSSAKNYTASGRTGNFSGYPDLSVRILSITPDAAQSASQHYIAQFVIENVGTNIASAGWMFNAQLPTNPPYTYPSAAQQKMYPGDKIVYTLGFDMQSQIAYTNTGYGYGYTSPSTACAPNYTYNGYANYPTPNYNCTIYTNNSYATNAYNPYAPNSYYPQTTYTSAGGTFSVTVDPQNLILESSEANNTASAQIGY